MSRRKPSIAVRRKGYSRRTAICVHPSKLLDSEELIVRLPVASYVSSVVEDTDSLNTRLCKYKLPAEWILNSKPALPLQSGTYLALYKLSIVTHSAPHFSADYSFMLTIAPDFSWSLCLGRNSVSIERCTLLQGLCNKLDRVDAVLSALSTLEQSRFCVGNPDSKFTELLHKGYFKEHSG